METAGFRIVIDGVFRRITVLPEARFTFALAVKVGDGGLSAA
jgi:hypothetical protein